MEALRAMINEQVKQRLYRELKEITTGIMDEVVSREVASRVRAQVSPYVKCRYHAPGPRPVLTYCGHLTSCRLKYLRQRETSSCIIKAKSRK